MPSSRGNCMNGVAVIGMTIMGWCVWGLAAHPADLVQWTDRVIPLPQEISIRQSVRVKAGEIHLADLPDNSPPLQTLRENLKSFALAPDTAHARVVIRCHLAGIGTNALAPSLLDRLKNLPNPEQAYVIFSGEDSGRQVVHLAANTPVGLLYASGTLRHLIAPQPGLAAAGEVEMPLPEIADWPVMEERGQWANDPTPSIPWYGAWKINLIEFSAQPVLDPATAAPRCRIDRAKIDRAYRHGIKAIPYIPHIASLRGNANVQNARYDPKLAKWLPALGQPAEGDNGLCASSPESAELLQAWLRDCAESIQGRHRDLEVWMTEMNRHCACQLCGKQDPKILELEMILRAYDRVRQKFPGLRLRIWLSQGTDRAGAHDAIIERLPPDVGLVYYNGTRTYISDRNPMIPDNLAAFSKRGGFLGVVPQLCHSWINVVPWTAPQFVHFRMMEYTDKGLNSISAYTMPSREFNEFNLMAMAEWGWNPRGRTPAEFARAYATVKGIAAPDRFAEWAMQAGEVGWVLAEARFYATLVYDPALGLHGEQAFDHRFAYDGDNLDVKRNELRQIIAAAEAAQALAREIGDPDVLLESNFALDSIRAFESLNAVAAWFRQKDLTLAERRELVRAMDRLDECAQRISVNLFAWKARHMRGIDYRLVGEDRLELTVQALLKACEIVRLLAAVRGINDARGGLRAVELGAWQTSDFRQGQATLEFKITDLFADDPDQWAYCTIDRDCLSGYSAALHEAELFRVKAGAEERTRIYSLRQDGGQHPNIHKKMFVLPAPRPAPGEEITLAVKLSVNAPAADAYPMRRDIHPEDSIGAIALRRIMNPTALTNLPDSTAEAQVDAAGAGAVNRRTAGDKIRVGIYSGYGSGAIQAALARQADLEVVALTSLLPEEIAGCHVLIVPQTEQSERLIRYAPHIARWVQNGGGALFFHDAVGFRRQMPVFRTIGIGVANPKLSRVTAAREHPLTAGIKPGEYFQPGFEFDHVVIEPGTAGAAVTVNEEGQAVVVAGRVGRGRVVLNGMMTGAAGAPNDPQGRPAAPRGAELRLLENAVRWLAGAPNLVTDGGAEGAVPAATGLPAGWGALIRHAEADAGVTDTEWHGGAKSVVMRVKQFSRAEGNPYFGLIFGNDLEGRGVPVAPGGRYAFSFWMKGRAPRVDVRICFWSKTGAQWAMQMNQAVREPLNLCVNNVPMQNAELRRGMKITPDPDRWTQYTGSFQARTNALGASAAVLFYPSDDLNTNAVIYLDDIALFSEEE